MESETFRKWLAERGCHFDTHEQHGRSQGHPGITIHREGRTARLTLGGAREDLDPRVIHQVCDALGLDWSELPGPVSRV